MRDPEVEDFHAPVFRQEQVLRLEIAVHDPAFVGRRQPLRHLCGVLQRTADREWSPGSQPVPQRLALKQLGDHEGDALVRRPPIEQREDVGMCERSHRAGFTLEALLHERVVGGAAEHDLDGHVAPEARIARPVDLAHAACAERRQDFVRAQACAGREWHAGRREPEVYGKRIRTDEAGSLGADQ